MPNISKFFKLNFNLVAEYEYSDESSLLGEDYWIFYHKQLKYYHYAQDTETFGDISVTNNVYTRQLMATDSSYSRWTQLDANDDNIRSNQFSASELLPFDTIKIHFPVDWIFENMWGILARVSVWNYTNKSLVYLSQYYYDKTLHTNSIYGNLQLTSPRLKFEDAIYGKYLELKIPAPYYVSRQRVQTQLSNTVKAGSINDIITGGIGLSLTSPIYLEFSYLTNRTKVDSTYFYFSSNRVQAATPQAAEYQTLGVSIKEIDNAFEIVGIYNDSASGFAQFIQNLDLQGNKSFVKYDITIIEQNIPGRSQTYIVEDNFFEPIELVPRIKISTTTVSIDVTLKIVSYLDGSEVTKNASINLTLEQINRYGRRKTKINIINTFNPKIYNPVPDNNIITAPISVSDQQTLIQYFPLLYDRSNIVIQTNSAIADGETYYGLGQLIIKVEPFTNVYKFITATKITDTQLEFLALPNDTRIQMVFKNSTLMTVSELYYDSKEVDLTKGVFVFYFDQEQTQIIQRIYKAGDRTFYIIISNSNGVENLLFNGYFDLR